MGTPGSAVDQNFNIVKELQDAFPDEDIRKEVMKGDYPGVRVPRTLLIPVLEYLKNEKEYDLLSDLTGADFPDRTPRFDVIYNLYSMTQGNRLLVHTGVPEDDPNIESSTPLWKAARWYEREVYDMYGVHFDNHPQHKRVLLYEEFEGHPLRKDYPKKKRQPLPMYYEKEEEENREEEHSDSSEESSNPEGSRS